LINDFSIINILILLTQKKTLINKLAIDKYLYFSNKNYCKALDDKRHTSTPTEEQKI